jgi:hypothetical protein
MSLSKLVKFGLLTITLVSSANNTILVLLFWFVLNAILGESCYAPVGSFIFEVQPLVSMLQVRFD